MTLRCGVVGLLILPFLFACNKKFATAADSAAASTDGFTVAAIAKTWTSNCNVGTEPVTGGSHNITSLTLNSGGTFMSQIFWYSGTCSPVNYQAIYTLYGTYTLGAYVSGSTTTKPLNFTIDLVDYGGSDLMTYGASTRTAYNSDCGGTSPFTGGANATDGGHVNTQYMNCMSELFPNSGARITFSNIATFSGGVLTLGAYQEANIPGTFPGGTLPTTATIPLNYRS